MLEYHHLTKHPKYKEIWKCSFRNEIGWLAQGMPGQVKGANTMFFITKDDVPQNRFRDVTYRQIIHDYWEGKMEPNRTRLTIGGNKINCPRDCGMPTADLLTIKLLLNSIMSVPKAKFMTMDIKFFYYNAPTQMI